MTAPHAGTGSTPEILSYGTWPSRITPDLVAGRTLGLSELQTDGDAVYWLESRPAEAGRTVLVRWTERDGMRDVTQAPFDVGTRVHEYGGGAYAVSGGRIAFSNRPDGSLWLMSDAPGAVPRALSHAPGLRFADLAFAPDGATLFCVREDHTAPGEAVSTLVAFRTDGADGGDPATQAGTVLAADADFVSSPRPSPDGTHLAWIEWDHPAMPWDATRLRLARLAGGAAPSLAEPRTLLDDGSSVIEPAWADERTLLVASDRDGWWNLLRVALPDGQATPVAPMRAEIGLPHWVFGLRSYRPLPGGSILAIAIEDGVARTILIVEDAVHPVPLGHPAACPSPLADGSLAWIDMPPDGPPAILHARADAPPRTLRAAAAPGLAPDDIARAETIRFPLPAGSGQDGHAFFYPPASLSYRGPADEKPPLIVMAHGGPTGRAGTAFSYKVQWWTSRGFAVVDVNYGGSTGFGRAYRRRLDGQWGVVDVADCIAACRHLVATGRVDPARIAMRGSSAGGLTVLLALAQSDLFAAGASLYGVTDLRALAQETHKFESRYLDRLVGPYPAAEDLYLARSPLARADAIRAPVLFLHGLDDAVVPPGQARDMVAALAANAVPHAHYEFAGESHGFRRAETIRRALELELDFYGRVFGFTVPDVAERVILRPADETP
ncbi:S9 family peptidase [Nguyenibacter vanlangensis]|uniref:S9 family peptidase n=1 Tax=Nguyenibacter vanlangensis TaxID=1216886 RepID=A0ABZ3D1M8_9PROT